MAKLDIQNLYESMNSILPDSGELGVVNMLYEVSNGKLASDDAAGVAAAEADDAKIAAVYAFMDLNGKGFHSARVFDYPGKSEDILKSLGEAIEALPNETEDELEVTPENVSNFPSVFAAMVAWQRSDAEIWYVMYRHPDLPHARACTILKHTRDRIDQERAERTAKDNAN